MSTYMLISSDSHIIEPPDPWEKRIDREFRERAPCLVHKVEVDQAMIATTPSSRAPK